MTLVDGYSDTNAERAEIYESRRLMKVAGIEGDELNCTAECVCVCLK